MNPFRHVLGRARQARRARANGAAAPMHLRRLLMQWHITNRCNLRCAHCYQASYGEDPPGYDRLLHVLEQYVRLLTHLGARTGGRWLPGQITLTGGEPLLHPSFFDLLAAFARYRSRFRFAVLTNGSLIDGDLADRLRRYDPSFVQVSLEGGADTHDRIRGQGSFERTALAVKHLVSSGVRAFVSFTAHRGNYHEFPEVARVAADLGVAKVWADRLIPCGSGAQMHDDLLTPEETREFFGIMASAKQELHHVAAATEVGMARSLQFLVAGGRPYRCSAGNSLITVMPNGDLYPCRRMPVRVGNVFETPLRDLYTDAELFGALRDEDRPIKGCQGCAYVRRCGGGLRCLTYAARGTAFSADPGCWRAQSSGHASVEPDHTGVPEL